MLRYGKKNGAIVSAPFYMPLATYLATAWHFLWDALLLLSHKMYALP